MEKLEPPHILLVGRLNGTAVMYILPEFFFKKKSFKFLNPVMVLGTEDEMVNRTDKVTTLRGLVF